MDAYTLLTRRSEQVFWITDDAIVWGDDPDDRIPFAGIASIRRFDQLGLVGSIPSAFACDVVARTGKRLSLISRRGGMDRSADFVRFDAELRSHAAAYPQAEVWTGMSKAVWASYALWFLCTASVFAGCSLFVVLFAWAWLSNDPTLPPAMGAFVSTILGSATGLNAVILWQTLRKQWPRKQGDQGPEDAAITWIACLPLFLIFASVFSIAALASLVSAIQWAVGSPAAPSMSLGSTFAVTAIVAGLITRTLWTVLRREWNRRKRCAARRSRRIERAA